VQLRSYSPQPEVAEGSCSLSAVSSLQQQFGVATGILSGAWVCLGLLSFSLLGLLAQEQQLVASWLLRVFVVARRFG
jgi:hypothetical protein